MICAAVPAATTCTVRHDDQPVALPGLFHVMSRHQRACAGLHRAGDGLPQPGPAQRIDAGGGLVQDQQLGLVRQRLGEGGAALKAERQLADRDRAARRSERPSGQPAGAARCGAVAAALARRRKRRRRTPGSPRRSGRRTGRGPAGRSRSGAGSRGSAAPPAARSGPSSAGSGRAASG